MDTGKGKKGGSSDADDLAKDVAHLYAMAHVEDVPYYTFSRQRRLDALADPLIDASHNSPVEASVAGSVANDATIHPPPNVAVPQSGKSTSISVHALDEHRVAPSRAPLTGEPYGGQQVDQSATARRSGPVANDALRSGALPARSRQGGEVSSAMAIFSLAGGVGKTTITANLGRILCSLGEKVLLVDASGSGLLPFYFGATDLRPGLRTFVAPEADCPPMHVIGVEDVTAEWMQREVAPAMRSVQRTIFDLGPASMAMLPQILSTCSVLLIPILSDLNSILTLPRIKALIAGMQHKGFKVPLPFFIFNKFDEHSPMDLEARNLALRQCEGRLLPNVIRRSPDVTTAISERMTVADHSSDSDVTHDFLDVALWLRKTAPVRLATKTVRRWSER